MRAVRPWSALWLAAVLRRRVLAQARELPDFTRLVDEQGNAVVNISTTQAVRRSGAVPQVPGMEDEEVLEFFRRFIPRQQPGQARAGRAPREPLARLGLHHQRRRLHPHQRARGRRRRRDQRALHRQARVQGQGDRRRPAHRHRGDQDRGAPACRRCKFGDPTKLKVGEWVVAIGSPFGFENTVTAGIVSAKGRSLPQENFVPFIQTDVAINPGNSGGPLFNMRGEVVGINSQIYSRTGGFMGLSFAIPIDVALDIQKQLRDKGRVARGRIGVVIQEVTRDLATSFGLDRPRGALVNSVEKGSPADKAGVEATDIITRASTASRWRARATCRASSARPARARSPRSRCGARARRSKLNITVGRAAGGPRRRGRHAGSAQAAGRGAGQPPGHRGGRALRRSRRRASACSYGLVVTDVRPDSKADVRKGDVLLTVVHKGQHTELKTVEQFNKLLAGLDKNAVITLQVRRGESTAFVTISGLTDKG